MTVNTAGFQVVGVAVAVCGAVLVVSLFAWLAGWTTVYVVERWAKYLGVHREILYFVRNRRELRAIIAKRHARRGVLGRMVTKRSLRWGRNAGL